MILKNNELIELFLEKITITPGLECSRPCCFNKYGERFFVKKIKEIVEKRIKLYDSYRCRNNI